jgi:hypothetical protein
MAIHIAVLPSVSYSNMQRSTACTQRLDHKTWRATRAYLGYRDARLLHECPIPNEHNTYTRKRKTQFIP